MTQDFESFGLPAKLLQALARLQYKEPTPIQAESIPLVMAGSDVLGSAQTGTGKTGAFGIPMIARLMEHTETTGLVLTPTRELATQVAASLQEMIPVPSLKIAVLIGGEAMFRQLRQLDHRPRIIVGTPGRINDHLTRGSLKLDKTSFLVLDETDRMLDMGFGPQIDQILKFVPKERQTLMFSATLPDNIVKLSRKYLNDPKRIAVGSSTMPVLKIKQELIRVSDTDKYPQLLAQLKERTGSVIIFVKTRYGTEKLADKLNKDNHRADAIHGDLQQRRRDRVIQGFRDKKYRILVATDVAARGLDIPHIEHVMNYDMPQCPEDYIHRIGRTARAGAEGAAVNFLTNADNAKWNAIYKLMHGTNDPNVRGGSGASNSDRKRGSWGNKRKSPPRKTWTKSSDQSGDREKSRDYARSERAPRQDSEVRQDRDHRVHKAHGEKPARREHAPLDGEKKPHSDRPQGDRPHRDRPHKERSHRGNAESEHRPHSESRTKSDRSQGDRFARDGKPQHRELAAHEEKGARSERPIRRERPFDRDKKSHSERTSFGEKSQRSDVKARKERPFDRDKKTSGDRPFGERPARGDKPHSEHRSGGQKSAQGHKRFSGPTRRPHSPTAKAS